MRINKALPFNAMKASDKKPFKLGQPITCGKEIILHLFHSNTNASGKLQQAKIILKSFRMPVVFFSEDNLREEYFMGLCSFDGF